MSVRIASAVTFLLCGVMFTQLAAAGDGPPAPGPAPAPALVPPPAPAPDGQASRKVVRIGIGAIGPVGLAADLRIRLEDAAAAGLKASGAEVMSAAELMRVRAGSGVGSCSNALCERRLAQITDMTYWLRGACQLETSTYHLHLELVDAQSGAVLVARDDTCDICTEADVAETASVAASALKASLGRGGAAPGMATASPAAGARPAAVAAQQPSQQSELPPAGSSSGSGSGSSSPAWRRVLPWVAFGAAAGAIAGGVYYLAINDNCVENSPTNHCHDQWDTRGQGLQLLGVGAALVAAGVVLLVIDDGEDGRGKPVAATPRPVGARISLSLNGVAISGRF